MTAVVIDAPGAYRFADGGTSAPGALEALVRVHAVGICHSDVDLYRGTSPAGTAHYPVTPGRAWSGIVERVGPGAPADLVGRKVVGRVVRGCRACDSCRTGDMYSCEGEQHSPGGIVPGAMAHTLRLPIRLLHTLPDDCDLTAAALLEPASRAAAALRLAGTVTGARVAVTGVGAVALLTVRLLASASPRELAVVAADERLGDRARRAGATSFHLLAEPPVGRYDTVIETTGAPATVRTAAALLRHGGRLVLTRPGRPDVTGLDPSDLVRRQTQIHTVLDASPEAWSEAVNVFVTGQIDTRALISHELPVGNFETAMNLAVEHGPVDGEVVLLF
ncbi:alcohol dehydrogenase catalytic domain-containing protein [Streptomyces sp. NPDC085995]|uniref:zinc-dependent alcohol dehydrogenase n=1 Tax=Streptomyces sp. NPDC085995 TaxID=3154861 RepID=UPI00344ACA3E